MAPTSFRTDLPESLGIEDISSYACQVSVRDHDTVICQVQCNPGVLKGRMAVRLNKQRLESLITVDNNKNRHVCR